MYSIGRLQGREKGEESGNAEGGGIDEIATAILLHVYIQFLPHVWRFLKI